MQMKRDIPIRLRDGHTLYAIKAWMTEDHRGISIGRLGAYSFRKGLYVYVGSAKRNLQARIDRHIQLEKKRRWHFDYLRPYLQLAEIETFPGEEGECGLFQRLLKENNGSIPVRGFGSSDCRCPAHLFFVPCCDEETGVGAREIGKKADFAVEAGNEGAWPRIRKNGSAH